MATSWLVIIDDVTVTNNIHNTVLCAVTALPMRVFPDTSTMS